MSTSATLSSSGLVEPSEQDLRYGMFQHLDQRAKEIEDINKRTWVEMAEIAQLMEDGGYWSEGGYTSFSSWLRSAMPCSYSWARLSMSIRKDLKEMAAEDLAKMPLANAEVIRRMEPQERKEILRTAQTLTPEQFLPVIVAERPELALEVKVKLRFTTTASQATIIQSAIKRWKEVHEEVIKDIDALEYICAEYLDDNRIEGKVDIQ